MSLLIDEEKRRRLIAQIEKTAEGIRKGQKDGVEIDEDYAQLFLLRPRSAMYSRLSHKHSKVRIVFIWLLVVMFLVSSTVLYLLMKKLEVI